MDKITVLARYTDISVFYSLKPFLFSRHSDMFTVTNDQKFCLEKDRNKTLILLRYFRKPDFVDIPFLERLKQKYDRIVFFNGDAGAGIPRFEVMPYVDFLFKKSLYRNRDLYMRPLYSNHIFTDYYHNKYGVADENVHQRTPLQDKKDLSKIKISWNVGVGNYPKSPKLQRIGLELAKRIDIKYAKWIYNRKPLSSMPRPSNGGTYLVNARFGMPDRPTVAYQRKLILKRIENEPDFLTGRVPSSKYKKEIRDSKITLSPFGWGEVCFRDFEAVLNGSLVLKPDMSHIETFPDIYRPYETYVPFEWDCSDLLEKAKHYARSEETDKICKRAYDLYMDSLEQVESRFEDVISLILGKPQTISRKAAM